MIVVEKIGRNDLVGNGSNKDFVYDFGILNENDIEVRDNGALKVIGTHYTVSGVGNSAGGTVSFLIAPINASPVILIRKQKVEQQSVYQQNEDFPAKRLENDIGKVVMVLQQLKEHLGRCLSFTKNSLLSNLIVPNGVVGKYLRWKTTTEIENVALTAVGTYVDPVTTEGDLIQGSATGTQERLAIGTRSAIAYVSSALKIAWFTLGAKGGVLVSNGVDFLWKTVGANGTYLRADSAQSDGQAWGALGGYRHGGTVSNSSGDATNDLDIAAGEWASDDAAFGDRVILTPGAMTKQIDAVWAAGTNAGGRLASDSLANGTWNVFAFRPSAGPDDYFLSASLNPTPPSGGKKRLIAQWLRESGSLVPIVQDGQYFRRKTSVLDISDTPPSTSSVLKLLSVPTGRKLFALLVGVAETANQGAAISIYWSDPDANDEAASRVAGRAQFAGYGYAAAATAATAAAWQGWIRTNTAAQIRQDAENTVSTLVASTLGWFDPNL